VVARVPDDPLPEVLAKSAQQGRPPESLAYHLEMTLRAATEVRDRVGRLEVAEAVLGGKFWRAALLAALVHDAGKLADGFQGMLAGSGGWGQRHEVVSLGFLPWLVTDPVLRRWIASAVVTHHRPLTESDRSIQRAYGAMDHDRLRTAMGEVNDENAHGLLRWLAGRAEMAGLPSGSGNGALDVVGSAYDQLQQVLDEWQEWQDDRDVGLAAALLQGTVTLADHLSSGHGSLLTTQPVGDGFGTALRRYLGGQLHPHQRDAERAGRHLLLRAPTGSGKTEAGLLWAAARVAETVRARGGTPRLFFTLPYLASINAMARRLARHVGGDGAVGVSHSRAASYYLATSITDDADDDDGLAAAARKAVARDKATRLFRETVRVGTPYQLLRGALAGPAHSGILADSANSVFVLDELHAYDARRLGYILAAVRLWERLGGSVAVLSATLPNALVALLRDTLHEEMTLVEAAENSRLSRHRLQMRDRHLTDPATEHEIRAWLAADQSVLVVANSVAHAQELFAALAPEVRDRHGPEAAVLLHSRFTRGDRTVLEDRIADRYGVRAGQRRPGLAVATQVVEVSLDVDFDVLFTAAAPLEAMLQRFGRVNRLGSRPPADVIVHAPVFKQRRGEPGEFADGVYPREPVECGWQILCRHTGEVVDEAEAVGWLDEVYATPWGARWRAEVGEYQARFEEAFLGFEFPYGSREDLEEEFDRLFDGTEAILAEDRERYERALTTPVREDGKADRAAGRLLGEEYLIPLPYWASRMAGWDRRLRVAVVDGEYDPERGLVAVRGPERAATAYRPGEVL
jgi:CRISPR-associated endonuclease/helicase Cas3